MVLPLVTAVSPAPGLVVTCCRQAGMVLCIHEGRESVSRQKRQHGPGPEVRVALRETELRSPGQVSPGLGLVLELQGWSLGEESI